MPSDKDTLLGMGFDPARVEWAIKATGGRGLQPAMDHLFENEEKPVPDLNATAETSKPAAPQQIDEDDEDDLAALQNLDMKGAAAAAAAAVASDSPTEAKSIKCSQCGKTFKNTSLANWHAEKSGHDQFEESAEEIKPLTEEEKKQKLAELREKMAAKRALKVEEDAKEAKANEAIRRKAGKDMNQIREELKLKEAQKEAEAKKREKIEDARARAAVKAQIEADKRARAEKAAMEKALREGRADPGATTPVNVPKPTAAAEATAGTAGRDFKDTRLQIRMSTGGQPLTTTLPSDALLREVAEYIAGQNLAVDVETVTLAQHFPRRTFTRADFSKSLRDLGLTPSAVILATP
ncbi:UBX domain-containing protein 1 [Leucoagaricus sp. SymC.cos]|nr:UBX domain-containing protein 1 [Leucoagaricus sp. SymC.cos]